MRDIGRRKKDSNTQEGTQTAVNISAFEDVTVMSSNVER